MDQHLLFPNITITKFSKTFGPKVFCHLQNELIGRSDSSFTNSLLNKVCTCGTSWLAVEFLLKHSFFSSFFLKWPDLRNEDVTSGWAAGQQVQERNHFHCNTVQHFLQNPKWFPGQREYWPQTSSGSFSRSVRPAWKVKVKRCLGKTNSMPKPP